LVDFHRFLDVFFVLRFFLAFLFGFGSLEHFSVVMGEDLVVVWGLVDRVSLISHLSITVLQLDHMGERTVQHLINHQSSALQTIQPIRTIHSVQRQIKYEPFNRTGGFRKTFIQQHQ
jgi:hypothetical protein